VIRRRLYEMLETEHPRDWSVRLTHFLIMAVILGNVVAVILESEPELQSRFGSWFLGFEQTSVAFFTVEYLLRIWVCVEAEEYRSPFRGRLRYAATPLALVDLLAIAPFYVPLIAADLRVIRAIRLFRFVRILKLGRYSDAFRLLGTVVSRKRQELAAAFTVLMALVVIAATLMYEVEHVAQPQKFRSILATMWWAVATLTTVGYGDVFPVTGAGKLLAAVISILGIGMFALPTSILGAGFVEELQARKSAHRICPHCGKPLH
jgi:voltage-gated potassium channel